MTDFTGSDTWHTTITGPSTGEPITAASVCDMGVLQADREMWLWGRVADAYRLAEIASDIDTATEALITDLKASTSYIDVIDAVTTVATVAEGDILIMHSEVHLKLDGAVKITLGHQWDATPASSPTLIAFPRVIHNRSDTDEIWHVSFATKLIVTPDMSGLPFAMRTVGKVSAGGATTAEVWGPSHAYVEVHRPNGNGS